MKVHKGLLVSFVAFTFAFMSIGGFALAQEERRQQLQLIQDSSEENADDNQQRSERADDRQTRVEGFIDNSRIEQVRGTCVAAQQRLEAAVQRSVGIETARSQVFENISERLNRLSARLQAAGIDTAQLDAEVASFDGLVTDFERQIEQYRLALQDAQTGNCEEDPEAFAYALEDARETLPELRRLSQEMRTQVREVIVSSLLEIRDDLTSSENETAPESEVNQEDGEEDV